MSDKSITVFASIEQLFERYEGKTFRFWYRDGDPGETANLMIVREIIPLANGDVLLGIQYDEGDYAEKYPNDRDYILLSEITFHLNECDQDENT